MDAAFVCRVGETQCEGEDFLLQNIVSCLVLSLGLVGDAFEAPVERVFARAFVSDIFQTFINPSLSYFFKASNASTSSTRCSWSVGPKSSMILFSTSLL